MLESALVAGGMAGRFCVLLRFGISSSTVWALLLTPLESVQKVWIGLNDWNRVNLKEIPDTDGSVKLKVLGIILDGPAHSAGVRQGDELLSVNGIDVSGKSAFDVSSLLQGPQEAFVTIEVKHNDCSPIEFIKVERKITARTPVFYHLEKMENGDLSIGYIRVEFNALAKKDLVIALKRLQDSGASYFVLDLKDNLGGLVQAGIEIAKLFLEKGETVMVNHRTASASEIVASSLHDNCKAVLVGEGHLARA